MTTLKPGDEVRVTARFGRSSRYSDMPDDGYPGTVTQVGLKYATAETAAIGSVEFVIETGYERGPGGISLRVNTLEQVAAHHRAAQARKVLYQVGFDIRPRYHPPMELLEALAAVAANFEERTEGEGSNA